MMYRRPNRRMLHWPSAVVIVIMAVLVAGCAVRSGATGNETTTSTPGNALGSTATVPHDALGEGIKIPTTQHDPRITKTLADGEVTYAEYESAVLAHVACMNNKGIETAGPIPVHAGLALSWNMKQPKGMSDDELFFIEDGCRERYLAAIEVVYIESIRPDAQSQAEFERLLQECLVEAGMDLESGMSERELVEATMDESQTVSVAPESTRACLKQHAPSVVFSD